MALIQSSHSRESGKDRQEWWKSNRVFEVRPIGANPAYYC